MKPLKGLPEIVEKELNAIKKDIATLETAQIKGPYLRELKTKYASMRWVIDKKDEQVVEALNWYRCYKENHTRLMYDYPDLAKEIENMPKMDYHKWLLEKAFEGLK